MDYQIRGKREVTITQYGDAWVTADTPAEARKEAEDDIDGLDWSWEDLDAEDGQIDTIEIIDVEGEEADEAEAEEEEL